MSRSPMVDSLERAVRAAGIELSGELMNSFVIFAQELKKWNHKINLTAITSDDEMSVKHFVDSLMLAQFLPDEGSLLDIGSGAGFPAIPVKLVKPRLEVMSVDAVGKKISFQRHAARVLGLKGFCAEHVRAEKLAASLPNTFDVVVSRAFSCLELFAGLARPLVRSGGRIVAMKGGGAHGEADAAAERLAGMGLHCADVELYSLPFGMGERGLVVLVSRNAA